MTNQLVGAESDIRTLTRGYYGERYRVAPRRAGRVINPQLMRRVRAANGWVKRAVDIVIASVALVFLSPLFLAIAIAIKLTDGGAVLYRHGRVGRLGARFDCYKFRTMGADSCAQLNRILATDPEAAEEWRLTQKLKNDPRVTWIGALLRKSSFDELPQLWNVLRGEMSVIGPRPVTRDELRRYGRSRRFYLLVRPGMTGLWQVSGRSSTTYDKRVELDRAYLEEWTWLGELWILLVTVPALLRTSETS
ncbi:MAG: sugar transferase [Hyphomonadaceae bacterium]|nr:sugar transferase [Hyphomonadaceae bacterium]